MTHLITLNQSLNERKEHTMRINVAKSRFSSVEMCSKLLPTMTMRYSTIDNVQSTSIRLNSYVLYKQGGKEYLIRELESELHAKLDGPRKT